MTEDQLIKKLTELRSLPAENEVVEFKEAKNDFHFDKIGKYFSSLCNEANLKGKPEAWLIFGVEDKRKKIVGSYYRNTNRASLDSLKGEIANKTTSRITFIEIYELKITEGRIILFQIPPAPQGLPIAWEGHYYGRDGEELVPLNLEEIERIRRQASYNDWSAAICPVATINDLDPLAIQKARQNFLIKNSRLAFEVENWSDDTFLTKTRLIVKGQVRNAAVILLGKKEATSYFQPALAQIAWVLYSKEKIEKDYQHFSPPYIISVDEVYAKIRNLRYRYMKVGTLFPDEVDQYDQQNIREALSNCIAHMDYTVGGRITVAENEDGYISFTNPGSFLAGSVEEVVAREEPPPYNRNSLLAETMVSFNMIDSIGSGIKRMFRSQRDRYFPMPDYELHSNKVKVTLIGKVLNVEYAKVLIKNPDLTLSEIMMLDKVQRKKELEDNEIKSLKDKKLIEGRKPNFHISAVVAKTTQQEANYILSKGFDDAYYKKLVEQYLTKFNKATRSDIDRVLLNKLPNVLSDEQKKYKVKNLLQSMKKEQRIKLKEDRTWMLNNAF